MTLDYFLGIALGELKMQVKEFWEMRLKDFFLKLHYYTNERQQKIEMYSNLVRLQTLTLVNLQLDTKHRISDPRKLWLFPWEVEEHRKPVNEVAVKEAINLSKYL